MAKSKQLIIDHFEDQIDITASTIKTLNFRTNSPNILVFSNNIADTVYISKTPLCDSSNYDMLIPAVSTKKFVSIDNLTQLFLYCATSGRLHYHAFNSSIDQNSFDTTIETVNAGSVLGTVNVNQIIDPLPAGTNSLGKVTIDALGALLDAYTTNYLASGSMLSFIKGISALLQQYPKPTAVSVTLTGGVESVVKASAGWVVAFGSGSYDNTEIRNGTGNMVWKGDYISQPFYCDTNIRLYHASNNTCTIVYL